MSRYDIARRDFELLESFAELSDQVELDAMRIELMQRPTKAKAADMYEMGIRLWLSEHRDIPGFEDIAERYAL